MIHINILYMYISFLILFRPLDRVIFLFRSCNINIMPTPYDQRQRLLRKLRLELGPDVLGALEDPSVVEILLNPDGSL